MTTLSASQARQRLPEALNQVAYRGERIVIKRRGKVVAVLVPQRDLDVLEAIEDQLDMEEVRKALAAAKRKGEKPVAWAKAKKALGL